MAVLQPIKFVKRPNNLCSSKNSDNKSPIWSCIWFQYGPAYDSHKTYPPSLRTVSPYLYYLQDGHCLLLREVGADFTVLFKAVVSSSWRGSTSLKNEPFRDGNSVPARRWCLEDAQWALRPERNDTTFSCSCCFFRVSKF